MIGNIKKTFLMALAGLTFFSCAKDKDESDRAVQERILNAYIIENCPTAKRLESGLTLLSYDKGYGDTVKTYRAAYVDYSVKTLDGSYAETTDAELAKRLGWFSNSNYYGPKLFEIGYNSTYAGVEELLTNMQVGGSATAIVPPWLTYTSNAKVWNTVASNIYEVKVKTVIKDILKFQADTMRSYAKINYPGLDTTSAYFYYKQLYDANPQADASDTLTNEAVKVFYIGRLLDGFVFDTNIADSAKKYGIYNSTKEYSALSVSFSEDAASMAEANSLVKGFCMALKKMNYGDKAFTMFYSEYGYSSNGSGQIGPYQPLIFWLYVAPKDED